MSKKIAITQSNYIPWKGYFDIIASVDTFILYDDMQYTKSDWRNRNKIQTRQGLQWLTIPVQVKGKFDQKIRDVQISDLNWAKKHWTTLQLAYSRSPYFQYFKPVMEELYLNCSYSYLSEINFLFLKSINELLGIHTELRWSSEFDLQGDKNERLVRLCQQLDASTYVSGPAAKNYIDDTVFQQADIRIEWMDYTDYPVYPQRYQPFEHGVSILDVLFNCGPHASDYLKNTSKSTLCLKSA